MMSGGTQVEMDGSVPRAAWGRLANRGGALPFDRCTHVHGTPSFFLPSFRLSARRRTWRGSRRRSCTWAISSSASTCPASARGKERGYREKEREREMLCHIYSYIKKERKRDAVPHTFVRQKREKERCCAKYMSTSTTTKREVLCHMHHIVYQGCAWPLERNGQQHPYIPGRLGGFLTTHTEVTANAPAVWARAAT